VFSIGVHPLSLGAPLDSLWKDYEMRKGFTRKPQADEPATPLKNYITPSGLERLKDEHRFLLTRERPAVTEVAYGLKARSGYSSTLTDEQITQQLVVRPVTYLLGEADVLPLGVFDVSCPAMAQGPTRLGRGLAFHKYVNEHLHAHHNVVVVPFCSHSQRCMFTSDAALPLMFPN